MTPRTLDGWTLDKISEIALTGVTENDQFDLKADLQPAEHQRKTVAAFANANGGFLIFGVTNDRRVEGVTNGELVRDFGNKLRDGLTPSVEFRFCDRPHVLPTGRFVYVAHVPKSIRGPHAVHVNSFWVFVRRTAAGSNDPMSYEELRAAMLDAGRRETELAWLRAKVAAVRDLAYRLNVAAHRGPLGLDLLVARFDVGQLKAMLLPVFGAIGSNPRLVDSLFDLVERCERIDSALAPMATLAMVPGDRSRPGGAFDGLAFVKEEAPQTVMRADDVLRGLDQILA